VKALYDVVEYKFDLVKEYIEEYGEDLNYERFLNLVGIVTCKVTPTSPKYNNYIKGTVPFFYDHDDGILANHTKFGDILAKLI